MKNTSVIVALIVGISLIVSAGILSFAIIEYARSFESAVNNRSIMIPSQFTVRLANGSSPMRFDVGLESGSSPVRLDLNSKR